MKRAPVVGLIVGIAAITALGVGAAHCGRLPYNVREMLGGGHPVMSAFLFALFLYWSLGVPVWIAGRLARGGRVAWALPALVCLHAVGAWAILRAAVPMESLHDVVGSPILGWPWEWEILGRFVALFSAWSLALVVAAAVVPVWRGRMTRAMFLPLTVTLVIAGPLIHWVVVSRAATDNLTELMAGGGGPRASFWLGVSLLLVALPGSVLSAAVVQRWRGARLTAVALVVVGLPLAYGALLTGTEAHVVKYGKGFSALQFLLSPDRAHLVSGWDLLFRYAVLYVASVLGIALVQFPFWTMTRRGERRR